MAKAKKVNPKEVSKAIVMEVVLKALLENDFNVKNGEAFGMTKGTLVVMTDNCDVQLKPIVPKSGVERYEEVEED